MDDFVFISVLITVCFLEVFFIVEDILGLKSFYDNKNTEISISDTAKFKSYMGLCYFYNQWLEEEKYKCALENGEIQKQQYLKAG